MIKPNNRAFARGKIGQPRSARGNAFPLWWRQPPKGEASAASQSQECLFCPMTQKSNSRNASCVPFRGRGPRSGEGVDCGKNDYDILILCLIALKGKRLITFSRRSAQGAADWRSGPRWSILSVLCPVHPFPLRGTSPQGETRDMERKTGRHILHVPFRCVPLWWLAPPPFPRKRGHYKTPLCCEPLMKELLFRALLSHHTVGGRWCRKAPKGGGKPPEVADRRNAFHDV